MTMGRRTAETIRIHVIRETLDSVAVEIHGAMLLIRADTVGILIGMRAIHGIRVIREAHVIQVIGDRMLVITVPREARVEMTEALHAMTVARVVTTEARVEMTEALHAMTVALHVMIVARVVTTEARVVTTEARVVTTEALHAMTVARVVMTGARVRARGVAAQVILAGTTEVRELTAASPSIVRTGISLG
jgi:hypothetical protein